MRVTILTTDGSTVDIGSMPDEDALDLAEEWLHGDEPVLTFELDDDCTTHIARAHIVWVALTVPHAKRRWTR